MSQRVIGKILEPLGCYQSNYAYLHSAQEQLAALRRSLFTIEEMENCLQQLHRALKEDDQREVVREALVFFKHLGRADRLQRIRQRVLSNEPLEDAMADQSIERVIDEVVQLMIEETEHQLKCLEILLVDTDSLAGLMEAKIATLPEAVVQWRWRERLGTPEAVHDCAMAVNRERSRAEQLGLKLNCLLHTLQINAH